MNFSGPILEVVGIITGLALVGLILSRANETATVVESLSSGFGDLIGVAVSGADDGSIGDFSRGSANIARAGKTRVGSNRGRADGKYGVDDPFWGGQRDKLLKGFGY